MTRKSVQVFRYIEALDCFVVTDEYRAIATELGLAEWNPVVWMGRLFALDNDYGEHWFDNWDLREGKQEQAAALGFDYEELLIIDPERFVNGVDGPCNNAELRKCFWTDVLQSLELSYSLLFEKAREVNFKTSEFLPEESIVDLEERILRIQTDSME